MRAKVASVVVVACGILGASALATPGTVTQLASRSAHHGDGGGGHDNGQQGNEYDHSCTSNDRHVIGSICVIVNDLPILHSVLSSVEES
jgi:hypothetical protein